MAPRVGVLLFYRLHQSTHRADVAALQLVILARPLKGGGDVVGEYREELHVIGGEPGLALPPVRPEDADGLLLGDQGAYDE